MREEYKKKILKFHCSICSLFIDDVYLGEPITSEGVLNLLQQVSQKQKTVKLMEQRFEILRSDIKRLKILLRVEKNNQIVPALRSLLMIKKEYDILSQQFDHNQLPFK